MAYCVRCGAYIPEGQSVCLACGYDPEAAQIALREKAEKEKNAKAGAAAAAGLEPTNTSARKTAPSASPAGPAAESAPTGAARSPPMSSASMCGRCAMPCLPAKCRLSPPIPAKAIETAAPVLYIILLEE